MSDYRELLLGCGHSRAKRIPTQEGGREWHNLVTLDFNPEVNPDVICDLDLITDIGGKKYWCALDYWGKEVPSCIDPKGCIIRPDYFNEVHAYEVLEHLGQQGNHQLFFMHFSEIWRILKPGGLLCATCPSRFSEGLWGDPGHRRVITGLSLVFLDQEQYSRQCDRELPTAMSDYRNVYKADFQLVDSHDDRRTFSFVLRAVKPSRWNAPG